MSTTASTGISRFQSTQILTKPVEQASFRLNTFATANQSTSDLFTLRFGAAQPPAEAASPDSAMTPEEALETLTDIFETAHTELLTQLKALGATTHNLPSQTQISQGLQKLAERDPDIQIANPTYNPAQVIEALTILTALQFGDKRRLNWEKPLGNQSFHAVTSIPTEIKNGPEINIQFDGEGHLFVGSNYGDEEMLAPSFVIEATPELQPQLDQLIDSIQKQL